MDVLEFFRDGIPRRRWLKQGGVWGVHLFELGRELCIIIDLTIFRLTALSDYYCESG